MTKINESQVSKLIPNVEEDLYFLVKKFNCVNNVKYYLYDYFFDEVTQIVFQSNFEKKESGIESLFLTTGLFKKPLFYKNFFILDREETSNPISKNLFSTEKKSNYCIVLPLFENINVFGFIQIFIRSDSRPEIDKKILSKFPIITSWMYKKYREIRLLKLLNLLEKDNNENQFEKYIEIFDLLEFARIHSINNYLFNNFTLISNFIKNMEPSILNNSPDEIMYNLKTLQKDIKFSYSNYFDFTNDSLSTFRWINVKEQITKIGRKYKGILKIVFWGNQKFQAYLNPNLFNICLDEIFQEAIQKTNNDFINDKLILFEVILVINEDSYEIIINYENPNNTSVMFKQMYKDFLSNQLHNNKKNNIISASKTVNLLKGHLWINEFSPTYTSISLFFWNNKTNVNPNISI